MKKDLKLSLYNLRIDAEVEVVEMVSSSIEPLMKERGWLILTLSHTLPNYNEIIPFADGQWHIGIHVRTNADDGTTQSDAKRNATQQARDIWRGELEIIILLPGPFFFLKLPKVLSPSRRYPCPVGLFYILLTLIVILTNVWGCSFCLWTLLA